MLVEAHSGACVGFFIFGIFLEFSLEFFGFVCTCWIKIECRIVSGGILIGSIDWIEGKAVWRVVGWQCLEQ